VDRVGRIGVDERAGPDERRAVGFEQLFCGNRRRKYKRKQKESERHTERRSNNSTEAEYHQPFPKSTHGSLRQ